MARRKDPRKLTDDELFAAIDELYKAVVAAFDAANGDISDPALKAANEELKRFTAEQDRRDAEKRKAKTEARKAAEAEAAAKKAVANRAKPQQKGRFSPEHADRLAVLREAYHVEMQSERDDAFYGMRLGERSRKRQQAIRRLADEGYLQELSKGYIYEGAPGVRRSELYSGRHYAITADGIDLLRAEGFEVGDTDELMAKREARIARIEKREAERKAREKAKAAVAERKPPENVSPASSRRVADSRYLTVQSTTRSVVDAVQELWRDATPDRILAALAGETGKAILNAVIAGQLSVAQGAQSFVAGTMLAQGASSTSVGQVVPGSLAGMAADGRPLATLLQLPGITTARALALGTSPDEAALMGLNQMSRLVATTLADTARTATSVAMTATPACVSYVRVVKLPACSRCIILAGRQYSYSTGFQRHPRCDCGMEPLSDKDWRAVASPEDLFKAMTPEQRRKRFGTAGAEAIERGADIGQVVNARRGMTTTSSGKKVTTEGTTRRGIGGKALDSGFQKARGQRLARAKEARLMPEQILKQTDNRDVQNALLRKHGYLT